MLKFGYAMILILYSIINLIFQKENIEYFECDKTVHYQISEEIDKILRGQKSVSFEDQAIDFRNYREHLETTEFGYETLFGNTPEIISDIQFLHELEKIGFEELELVEEKTKLLNAIFVKKSSDLKREYEIECEPVYRDILVFSNKGVITGIAKICIQCEKYHIIGSQVTTENFGLSGEYEELENILKRR